MVSERLPDKNPSLDVSLLGDKLHFPTANQDAKNRFLKAAMSEHLATWVTSEPSKSGIPLKKLINVYEKWGAGDWGVVLTGNIQIDVKHVEGAGNAIVCKENDTPELREALSELAKLGKRDGTLIVPQVSHAGRQTPLIINPTPFGASDLQLGTTHFGVYGKPVALTKEQIREEVVERFAYTAKVLYETGFDGLELHGAHGYLISQFLSPSTNTREDEYGGDAVARTRLTREIYEAIRREVPVSTGFILGIKMNSVEFQAKGLETNDAAIIAAELEKIGYDFIELSGGTYEDLGFENRRESTIQREAFFIDFADQIRKSVKKLIVYVTGGFRTASAMAQAVLDGACDGIGIGRFACAEPDFPHKILSKGIRAGPAIKLNYDDYFATAGAAGAQLGAMGKRSLEEANGDINADIPDFTRDELIPLYVEQVTAHFIKATAAAQAGQIFLEHFDFVEPSAAS